MEKADILIFHSLEVDAFLPPFIELMFQRK
jgi:hypothetical protein